LALQTLLDVRSHNLHRRMAVLLRRSLLATPPPLQNVRALEIFDAFASLRLRDEPVATTAALLLLAAAAEFSAALLPAAAAEAKRSVAAWAAHDDAFVRRLARDVAASTSLGPTDGRDLFLALAEGLEEFAAHIGAQLWLRREELREEGGVWRDAVVTRALRHANYAVKKLGLFAFCDEGYAAPEGVVGGGGMARTELTDAAFVCLRDPHVARGMRLRGEGLDVTSATVGDLINWAHFFIPATKRFYF
jgi:hypothetical protein